MRAILPGKPQARLQAVTTGSWEGKQIIACIRSCLCLGCKAANLSFFGNAVIILDGPNSILQTIYLELSDELIAIVLDELSGKVAAASSSTVHVYKPYGRDEGALRVCRPYPLGYSDLVLILETVVATMPSKSYRG